MLSAFIESVRYVGHLVPVSFLRIFLGYSYLQMALLKIQSDFLEKPRLASQIGELLPNLQMAAWYKELIESVYLPHWQTMAFVVTGLELTIGISYLLGFVVRPVAFLACLLSLHQLALTLPADDHGPRLLLAVHFLMAWIGAGRCLGLDYFYFKRRRGLWW